MYFLQLCWRANQFRISVWWTWKTPVPLTPWPATWILKETWGSPCLSPYHKPVLLPNLKKQTISLPQEVMEGEKNHRLDHLSVVARDLMLSMLLQLVIFSFCQGNTLCYFLQIYQTTRKSWMDGWMNELVHEWGDESHLGHKRKLKCSKASSFRAWSWDQQLRPTAVRHALSQLHPRPIELKCAF